MDPIPLVPVPVGRESGPPAIADEVGLQPAGQAVFAGGSDEAIGDQDERPVGKRHAPGFTQRRVEDTPQPELVEHGADGEDRPPGGGVEDVGVLGLGVSERPPPRSRWSFGRISPRRSLRPRSARVRCLTLPWSRTASTTRT